MRKSITGLALAAAFAATPAAAATTIFNSGFENVQGGPTFGTYTIVSSADGWIGRPSSGGHLYGIELQNHVAGSPAADGGNVFVELDTDRNSYMTRTIGKGTYSLSYEYSGRPGVPANSNTIGVFLNGNLLTSIAQAGRADTNWGLLNVNFTATGPSTLEFRAYGPGNSVGDGLGGYIDNIRLESAVPEPATWGLMILGFGLVGGVLRRRPRARVALA